MGFGTRAAKSALFVSSLRKKTSDRLYDSTVFMKESVSSSADIVRQAGGIGATGTTLVSFGSCILLAIVGVIIVVAFRRKVESAPEEGAQLKAPLDGDLEAFEGAAGDEIECENPLTLVGTTVNAGFEFEADD
jgi:hypothetical protein